MSSDIAFYLNIFKNKFLNLVTFMYKDIYCNIDKETTYKYSLTEN